MKKHDACLKFIFSLSFILIAVTTYAQWAVQTSPLGSKILGKMQFVSATEGWIACGSNGSLIHTTNAGTQWTVVTPFPADTAMSNPSDIGLTMSWPNATHGWALKTYGSLDNPNGATLYQTANGGTSWSKKDFPKLVPSVTYSAADLVGTWQVHVLYVDNPKDDHVFNGLGYGSTTISTDGSSTSTMTNITNSGTQTATRTSTSPSNVSSKGIITLPGNDMYGFISSDKNSVILTNTDGSGGYNLIVWQKVNPATVYTTADLQGTWLMHSIQSQSNAGWAHGTITMDATGSGSVNGYGPDNSQFSNTFSSSLSSGGILTSNGTDMNGFMSADKQTIYMTQSQNGGYCLNILQKKVTGSTYSAADLVGNWQLHGLSIASSSAAWIHCLYKINAFGNVTATKMSRNNVDMSDMTSTISISSDGTLTGFGSSDANGFLSADKSLGVNTLSDGSGGYYLSIYQKDLSSSGDTGLQVQFADNNTGWASVYNFIYNDFKLYKTTNGGSSWDVINGITNPVGGFYYFTDALNGWMFGASASTTGSNTDILHTTDGGLSWTTQATNIGTAHAIHFSDALHGWVVGNNGLVMNTTDGGAHWTSLTNLGLASNATNKAVFALNSNVCFISSSIPNTPGGRTVLKTTNGGSSWTTITSPFQYDIFSMSFWSENNGWISGDYGQIAHFTGFTDVSNPANQGIKLSPNPASSHIKINGVSETCPVLIYDVNGRCLIDTQAGVDNQLDIKPLNPGIYFLKLPTAVYNQSLIFIKQ